MPRPDLTEERTALILDAFARCVARQGLDATSLENVADEAGVKRSILRHYIGNRDDLVLALAQRSITRYRADVVTMIESLPETRPAHALLDYLFWDHGMDSADDVQVVEAMIAAAGRDERIRALVKAWVDEFIQAVADTLHRHFPGADKSRCWSAAYGVVGIYNNHESLVQLRLPDTYRRAGRAAAEALVETLAT